MNRVLLKKQSDTIVILQEFPQRYNFRIKTERGNGILGYIDSYKDGNIFVEYRWNDGMDDRDANFSFCTRKVGEEKVTAIIVTTGDMEGTLEIKPVF